MSDKENKPLNKIIREVKGSKKFKVYVKKNSKSNRESFMARHGAILKKVKGQKNLSPVYWALRSWKLGTKIS